MQKVSSQINFETVTFGFCNSITIESSYNTLTDTAKITVPKKVKFRDESGNNVKEIAKGEKAVFKRGDSVSIWLGYDTNFDALPYGQVVENHERFSGYISGVATKYPLEFTCEDDAYFLKQNSHTLTMSNPKLSALLSEVMPELVRYEVHADINLGDFRITNASTAAVLDELRKKHGIYSWFRNGTLNVGLAVVPALQKTVTFRIFRDIIDASSLQYINDFDRKIKLVAKSIRDDNTTIEATAGDADGETRTLYFDNIATVQDLQKIADGKVEQLKYSGYEGSFKTFGGKFVNHGDAVEIINPQIPEQSGTYLADKVVTECGMNGIKQTISIKQKIA